MANFSLFCHCCFNFSSIKLKLGYTTKQPFMYNIVPTHDNILLQKKITSVLKGHFYVPLCPCMGHNG